MNEGAWGLCVLGPKHKIIAEGEGQWERPVQREAILTVFEKAQRKLWWGPEQGRAPSVAPIK